MNAATLKALKGSIKKWEAIVAGTGRDESNDNCPLCEMFLNHVEGNDEICAGCPVFERTGVVGCCDTPYTTKWAKNGGGCSEVANTPVLLAAARAELRFLEGLLPKRKTR